MNAAPIAAGTVNSVPVNAGMLRDTDLSPYMNPYLDNVVNSALADLQQARGQQRVADNQSAVQAHAFGGSRQGVADALTNDAYLRNVASTDSSLRSAGYDKAVAAAQGDLDRALGAGQFNSNQAYDAQRTNVANRLSADQFNSNQAYNAGMANIANRLTADQFNSNQAYNLANTNAANQFAADTYNANAATAADQYNLGNLLNISQMNAANDLAGANFRLGAANQYAGLGSAYFNQLAQQGDLYSQVGASSRRCSRPRMMRPMRSS